VTGTPYAFDRRSAIAGYRANRARTRDLFDVLAEEAYYERPIAQRHPLVFYEGHLPAFSFLTLVRRALGGPGIDERLEALFARGIDPAETDPGADPSAAWPSRAEVRAFADEADRRVLDALEGHHLEVRGHPLLDRAEAVHTILEHEAMHHETLLYMFHRLPFHRKRRPPGYAPHTGAGAPADEWIPVPGGQARVGCDRNDVPFGWDNEQPACVTDVPPFEIGRFDVTNERYRAFIDAGGYIDPRWWRAEDFAWARREGMEHPRFWERHDGVWYWRGMFGLVPLPDAWPVYVSHAEASAFARWSGARLPTEAEWVRAAYGDTGAPHPWGHAEPGAEHGVFDFSSWDPAPVGSHPAGASPFGAEDLVGNGWEWTGTPFAPHPGFRPMASYPQYSTDFFDGEHFVMKGASPATARALLRPTFRNWFRARYPWTYATFRLARSSWTS
jgi:ergothioneine biosynthesis protein EgtB